MNFKFIFSIAIVLLMAYSVYCDSDIIGKNPCRQLNNKICGSDGNTYGDVFEFCQAHGNDSSQYISNGGPCCSTSYCESLSYTTLMRGVRDGKHIITIGSMPAEYTTEQIWGIPTNQQPDSVPIYQCAINGSGILVTRNQKCDGLTTSVGVSLGHIFTKQICETMPLFMCFSDAKHDYKVSRFAHCEMFDYRAISLIGYGKQY